MYIKRNSAGELIAISQQREDGIDEWMADDAKELHDFLLQLKTTSMTLEKSDQAMARVLEDVVNLLVEQGTIRFTDLPEAAQLKLLSRRELRGHRQGMNLLDDGDDDLNI